jgi:RHS repeat-associated protein
VAGWSYDADGNLLNDGRNNYAYDAEGRIVSLNGQPTYLYDAEGRRVAKLGSGGAVTTGYLLDLDGRQVTELNMAVGLMHSNVWAPGGRLLATYEYSGESKPNTWHFHLTDWLGTNRMQTTAAGGQEEVCYSYPFGDGLTCQGAADATEHHFTTKERDAESGLDYFYARYYSSDLARFMTPDWAAAPTAVPYATFGDPQTLNLYAYVNNNPNSQIDLGGHDYGNITAILNSGAYTSDSSTGDQFAADQTRAANATSPSGSTTDQNQKKDDPPKAQNPSPNDPVQNQSQPGQNATNNNKDSKDSSSNAPNNEIAQNTPMSNPQAVAYKAKVNPPGAESPAPTLKQVAAPAKEVEESRLAQATRLLGEAIAHAMEGFSDFIVCLTCKEIRDPSGHKYSEVYGHPLM